MRWNFVPFLWDPYCLHSILIKKILFYFHLLYFHHLNQTHPTWLTLLAPPCASGMEEHGDLSCKNHLSPVVFVHAVSKSSVQACGPVTHVYYCFRCSVSQVSWELNWWPKFLLHSITFCIYSYLTAFALLFSGQHHTK